MALTEVRLPALGEGIIEATITRWLVKPGDKVGTETPLVEIATDKVDTEVFSPVEGIVAEIILPEQSVPKIGQVLLRIFSESAEEKNGSPEIAPFTPEPEIATIQQHPAEKPQVKKTDRRFISPFVRYLASSEGITPDELYNIPGTGTDGQLTKDDILSYVLKSAPITISQKPNGYEKEQKEVIPAPSELIAGPDETLIPMGRVRKLIAKNMSESKRIAPHVTVFSEVDVTPIVDWRNKVKTKFREKYNENLTFTPIFIEAVAKALRDFPGINISVKEDFIVRKNSINISMAVALPDGNLIVPVVKNADKLNLPELSRQVNDLSNRARNGKLKPVEIQEGTFTITNIGSFGIFREHPS
jgi:2-oxoglutarate dehydrogenase E2 component (dihydrolipoamide succinyltransferase)